MTRIRLDDQSYDIEPGESILECLERHDVDLPSSCRSGTCQSCLVQAHEGTVPTQAQAGLKQAWVEKNYLLACVCRPTEDLTLRRLGDAETSPATVDGIERLSDTVTRLRLRVDPSFAFEAGQYVTLLRSDGLARSYSIASLPAQKVLELHVRHIPGGQMSAWIHHEIELGEPVRVRGPLGDCFYVPGSPDDPILLCGTGTGLAPLWGILRQALAHEHRGPLVLVHGARSSEGLYLEDELSRLSRENEAVHYLPCVLEGGSDGVPQGRVDEVALGAVELLGPLAAARGYLCGDPDTVQGLRKSLFLRGMSLPRIAMDPFIVAAPKPEERATDAATS